MRIIYVILAILLVFLINGCNNNIEDKRGNDKTKSSKITKFDELAAIRKVKKQFISNLNNFPDKVGAQKGFIEVRGKNPNHKIKGEFETVVDKIDDGVYEVNFQEFWDSKDFRYEGEREGKLTYYWRYKVSKDKIELISEGGNFPPHAVK